MNNNNKTKIRFFDIETTNLGADFGRLVCMCWKDLGEDKVHRIVTDEIYNDAQTAIRSRNILTEADIIVGHYSTKFDLPFINSRLLAHNEYPVGPVKHIDTWRVARNNMRLQSNRMDNIAEHFDVGRKTKLPKKTWIRLNLGYADAKTDIVDYCEQDVRVLEDVYLKMRPIMTQHPNVNLIGLNEDGTHNCPACGSQRVQKRGFTIAHAMMTQRWHCQGCGKWSRGKPFRPDGVKVEVR